MKTLKNSCYSIFSLIILMILIIGCGVYLPDPGPIESKTPGFTLTATYILPTQLIATITPFQFIRSTTTSTPNYTSTATITPTPTQPPTLTPQPTLSEIESEKRVVDLLTTNGNCLFPCYWGITPGKTSWSETKNLLLSISSNFFSVVVLRDPNIEGVEWMYHPLSEEKYKSLLDQTYYIKDDHILVISPWLPRGRYAFPEAVNRYNLNNVLKVYGKPEEILIQTYPDNPTGIHPFRILIIYLNRGIMINYEQEGQQSGNMIYTCYIGEPSQIYFWDPGVIKTVDNLVAITGFPLYEDQSYQPLAKATDLTIDKFYDEITKSGAPLCIVTPVEKW